MIGWRIPLAAGVSAGAVMWAVAAFAAPALCDSVARPVMDSPTPAPAFSGAPVNPLASVACLSAAFAAPSGARHHYGVFSAGVLRGGQAGDSALQKAARAGHPAAVVERALRTIIPSGSLLPAARPAQDFAGFERQVEELSRAVPAPAALDERHRELQAVRLATQPLVAENNAEALLLNALIDVEIDRTVSAIRVAEGVAALRAAIENVKSKGQTSSPDHVVALDMMARRVLQEPVPAPYPYTLTASARDKLNLAGQQGAEVALTLLTFGEMAAGRRVEGDDAGLLWFDAGARLIDGANPAFAERFRQLADGGEPYAARLARSPDQ